MSNKERSVEEIALEHAYPATQYGTQRVVSVSRVEELLQAEREKQEEAYKQGEEKALRSKYVQNKIKEAVENALVEYRQFIYNVLDGIDIAHGSCDTKAIRLAIQSRTITQTKEVPEGDSTQSGEQRH
jgi:hypothetical protein